jgi:hypothetical protein
MQQSADFFCKEIVPEHPRLEAPFPLLGYLHATAQLLGSVSRRFHTFFAGTHEN